VAQCPPGVECAGAAAGRFAQRTGEDVIKDPTDWFEDLTVHVDDEEIVETAAAMEPTLVYAGSKATAGAWMALMGILGGAFGAVTLSPAIREGWAPFVAYLAAALIVIRGVHPLTVRLFGTAVAWLAVSALFWGFAQGAVAVLGARVDSRLLGYGISAGLGALVGLLYGSLNPGVVRREDIWLTVALPLAPLSSSLATYLLRNNPGSVDSIVTSAAAGALAGGLFLVVMGALLARLWNEAHGLGRMGLLFLHNDNYAAKAVAYLDRAIAIAPNDAELYNLRGIAWSKLNESSRAEADWRKVAELSPGDPEPLMNRGVNFLRQGSLDQAIEALQGVLTIAPDHATAHSNLGSALERRGELDRAIEHYDRAIVLVPKYSKAFSNRGYAHFLKGNHQQALEDCERAIDLEPRLAMAHVNRGHALAALGQHDAAAASFRSALELEPDPAVKDEALRAYERLQGTASGDGAP
jgi:Flp pilus assembly protein TadD